jgi:putative membrane protein
MFGLILYTNRPLQPKLLLFFFIIFCSGILVEMIGTKTGWLFGKYAYGQVLGAGIMNVPFIIGINWCMIIYCCGVSTHMLMSSLIQKLPDAKKETSSFLNKWSVIIDGALLALLFDWLMEPVAIQLGYWHWLKDGTIPLYNYFCWFIISMIFLFIFQQFNINKTNKFVVHLLLIQSMFFLLLRTFL